MEKLKIFLDDLRIMPDGYNMLFRTGEELIEFLKSNKTPIELISFDHDLGENVIDGTAVCRILVDMEITADRIQFHTDNFVTLENMYSIMNSANRVGKIHVNDVCPHKISVINGIETINTFYNAGAR